ncbi:DUF3011 domain-containing protein [Sandaracinobacteroides hominis]|uniref:DUF3011 domain-containing protein n=1 Tax=Sandaracinobacteroides hominis TaxID=2780086 RepID=UPI0018F49257|nr:DUF3011 domain-containing protein [Sandaracinobacteroides hominis]
MAFPDKSMSWGAALSLVAAQLAPLPVPLLAMAPAAAQYGAEPFRVNCYSSGNQTRSCDLPRNTQSVTFIGPDRSGRCREGDTWRRVGNQIRVSDGCGGTFEAMVYQGGGSGGGWGGGSGGGSGGGWGGGNGQGFAGEVTCRSRDNREERCSANTGGRVQLLQQYSSASCRQGSTWRYDRYSIIVRQGCQARFGYGYGNYDGGSGGGWGGGNNQGFAGQTECRSDDNRYRRCSVNTNNRVEMLRQFSSSSCTRGRSWGYDRNSIWVDNGCQARFGYGYGNVTGDTSGGSSGGSNTGAVIGGVALAAGLVALLAAAGKSSNSSSNSSNVAQLDADLGKFPSDARVSGEACMKEAARQIGATGGTRVRLDTLDTASRSGDGWMILARITATYPQQTRQVTMDCRATGSKVTAFDVR